MPKKSCKHCGIVDFKHVCPVSKRNKNKRDNKRLDKAIYNDPRWEMLRTDILDQYKHICLYNFYVNGVIKEGNEVHHIVTLMENSSLAYERSNLILLSNDIHKQVHRAYRTEEKKKMINVLIKCNELHSVYGFNVESLGCLAVDRKVPPRV